MSTARAQQLLVEFRSTGDTDVFMRCMNEALDGLADVSPGDPEYEEALATVIEYFFAYFGSTGNFAGIDCAIEMIRRQRDLGFVCTAQGPWALKHPTWPGGTFSRGLTDPAWTLHHPDGRKSLIWKDWKGWDGVEWPMGWQVRRPDGVLIELDEGQFGDSWAFGETPEQFRARQQARTIAEATALVISHREWTDGELAMVEQYLGPRRDLRVLDPEERAELRAAWLNAMPGARDVLSSVRGWLFVAAMSTAAIGILRECLAFGRDAREYFYVDGEDHLDVDIVLAFGNHWDPVRQFTPTDALATGFRRLGGIPSRETMMSDRLFGDTVMSIAQFLRAVDQVPSRITDWEPYSTQPLPSGEEILHHDGRTGEFRRAELPPWYSEQNNWIALLSVRCGFAHAAAAPREIVELYELVTAEV